MYEIKKMLNLAVSAAKEAGRFSAGNINAVKEIICKGGPNNLVTDVDKKCEKMILDKIIGTFPTHSILAEETGEHNAADGGKVKWVVDPLDGTTNFAHGFPIFCTSIGILIDGESRIGVVYDGTRDELFTAVKGEGAFLNGKKITVSSTAILQNALVATGFSYDIEGKVANVDHFKTALSRVQAIRRAGSAAIDLCYVACGRLDAFWEFDLAPWDTAAASLLVSEAGGMVTVCDQGPFNIFKKEIVATNGKVHREMLDLLNENRD